jgi:endonuclease/exonuclease/phosphatase (EEP) superfamily protein YafD
MSPWRILAAATAVEVCFASAAVAALGLAGAVNGWLDLINCVAPLLIMTGVLGAAGARATWPKSRFRGVCVAAGAAAAAYGGLVSLPEAGGALFGLAGGDPGGAPYRVVAANVYRDNVVPFRAVPVLLDRRADALIVVESSGLERARAILAAAYPYSSACQDAGVEIWLRTPILAQGCRMPAPPGAYKSVGQGFAWVRTLGPDGRPLVLAAVHLARPVPPRWQPIERRVLADALAPFSGQRVLLAGDVNTAPWSFAMRELDRRLRPLQRWTFWRPTYPTLVKRQPTPALLPIDHVYANSGWRPAHIAQFRTPGSDHLALQIDARLQ